jgi:hypothetical protein
MQIKHFLIICFWSSLAIENIDAQILSISNYDTLDFYNLGGQILKITILFLLRTIAPLIRPLKYP